LPGFLSGLFDSNEKELKRLQPYVDCINGLEPEFQKLSDDELKAKTLEFKARVAEAVSDIQPRLEEAQRELEEARQHLSGVSWDVERDEASRQVHSVQDRIKQIEKERHKIEGEVLDEILPEAFAAVREAARRTIGQRHYDVQLLGGVTLHQGKIAEMKTGEGKTLVATLPLYLNSLTGRGAHLVTVNDYLSRRDPYWMGPIYTALGITVASIYPMQQQDKNLPAQLQEVQEYTPARSYDLNFDALNFIDVNNASEGQIKNLERWRHFRPISRQEAYRADITYGTSAEFGFDYLRDNMVADLSRCVQRQPLYYAIVDEVDNLLIDEARTPLIISGEAEETGALYKAVDDVVNRLKIKVLPSEPQKSFRSEEEEAALEAEYDAVAYEKEHYVRETARGQEKLARAFRMRAVDLFGGEDGAEARYLSIEEAKKLNDIRSIFRQSLVAHALFHRDRQYVIEPGGEIVIIDEFTGRKMYGRRYSEGLHQAIEAKEHVKVQRESMTYATITIQNFFRMYEKLAGMTGTAATEAEEFYKIYKLEVTTIPTNKPMIRQDLSDQIYKTEAGKYRAVVKEIKELHEKGRPVLVGTVSIENSVKLSDMLKRQGVTCQVLNAKEHTREGEIIAHAGEPGTVTVATNMAGRGVDIILGGSPDGNGYDGWQKKHDQIIELGGLHIIGTERHEARRIDNQLRGRAGRQGDPGSSRFFVSLEDDIMRRFGGDRLKTVMGWVGLDEDTPIENKFITGAITDVQKRVEGYHFDMRKHLVEYDDVVNKHRELIYEERHKILSGADLKSNILEMVAQELKNIVAAHGMDRYGEGRDTVALLAEANIVMPLPREFNAKSVEGLSSAEIENKLLELAAALYDQREKEMGPDKMRLLERLVMLQTIDRLWIEHLTAMEHMRLQAGWAALQQMKSTDAYKSTGYRQFQTLLETIRHDVAHTVFHVSLVQKDAKQPQSPMAKAGVGSQGNKKPKVPAQVAGKKVGRNDLCPCGSGKKYKHCCGR
jgi:preprotein translocase subunit SecA